MSEQEKYDEIIRKKFAEKEFLFNEENWERAEKMLDSSRRSRKVFLWSSVFIIGLICGLGLMFLLNKEKSNVNNKINTVNQRVTEPKNFSSDQKTTNEQHDSSTDLPFDAAPLLKQHLDSNVKGAADQGSVEPSDKNNLKNQTAQTSGHSAAGSSVRQQKLKTKNRIDTDSENQNLSEKAEENSGKGFSKPGFHAKRGIQRKNKVNKKTTWSDLDDPQVKSSQGELIANSKMKKAVQLKAVKKENDEHTNALSKNAIKKSGAVEKAETATDPAKSETRDTTESDPKELTASDSLNDSMKVEVKKLATADSVGPKTDSALTTGKSVEPLPMDGLSAVTSVSIEAGMNAQLGWQYENTTEGRGITPVAGIGITHCFNQKWAVSSGIQYSSITNLKVISKKLATTYSFGSFTTETTIKPGVLNYLVIPLTMHYSLNEKNAIFAGFTGSYLLPKKYRGESRSTYVAPDPASRETLVQKTSDDSFKNAFKPVDASVCAGYRRKISSHFSITAIANCGLLDVKMNAFFSQNKSERNNSLKLLLSYTIFDF